MSFFHAHLTTVIQRGNFMAGRVEGKLFHRLLGPNCIQLSVEKRRLSLLTARPAAIVVATVQRLPPVANG
jgi:hypothetical protein